MTQVVPMQPPTILPEVDETTGRGKRIRQAEKNFGMTCIDTMGKQAEHVREIKPPHNTPVPMDAFVQQFANQGES